MKNCVGILLRIILCILLTLSLSGCWNRRELDTLGIVMGAGIDKATEAEKVQLTVQIVKPGEIKSKNSEGGSGSQAFWNVTGTGNTIFATLRDMANKSSRSFFFPHNQVIIFGNELAKQGIQKYIDFFMRDPETRMNVSVLIAQGTATEILNVKSELDKVPASSIAKLVKLRSKATSQIRAVMLRDLVPGLMSKTTSFTVPFIKTVTDGDKKVVTVYETAVFKRDKLVGSMNKTEGRGLMWILGKAKSGIIEIKGPGNDMVSVEIIRASSKIVPEINNNTITMKVTIHEEGNIGEQSGPENLSKLIEVAALEKKIDEAIKNEVIAAVKKSQQLNTDVFGFGDAIHKKYPKQWKDLEGNWDELFKDIQVEVKVDARLRIMGRIFTPSVPEQEGK
jgi:spore germination protein KC